MRNYEVAEGKHIDEGGTAHTKGSVVTSHLELAKLFPGKFIDKGEVHETSQPDLSEEELTKEEDAPKVTRRKKKGSKANDDWDD